MISSKLMSILSGARFLASAAIVFCFSLSAPVSATVLTFDSLTGCCHFGPYSEAGYTLTMSGGDNPHYGDGSGAVSGTLNWHDGGSNANGVLVMLTKDDGFNFDFTAFDLVSLGGTFSVSAPGFGPINYNAAGPQSLSFLNVAFVTFDLGFDVVIDNLVLNQASGVPEPATLSLIGIGLAGLAGRRRRKATDWVKVSV